jgi:hypothetical protein
MKTKNSLVVSSLIIVGMVISCGIAIGAEYKAEARASTVAELSLEKGSALRLEMEPGDFERLLQKSAIQGGEKLPVKFEWRKNFISIPGQTEKRLIINNLNTNHVGSYTLLMTGGVEAETAPVHVGIYIELTNTSGRILLEPIGKFTTQNNTISCSVTTFTRIKTYSAFPSPTYPNTDNDPKLTINTCFAENGMSVNTAVVIRTNTYQWPEHSCNDAIDPPFGPNAALAMCTNITLSAGVTFRASIYLKNISGVENVTWSYLYHP